MVGDGPAPAAAAGARGLAGCAWLRRGPASTRSKDEKGKAATNPGRAPSVHNPPARPLALHVEHGRRRDAR